jgi:hypothetical protein
LPKAALTAGMANTCPIDTSAKSIPKSRYAATAMLPVQISKLPAIPIIAVCV